MSVFFQPCLGDPVDYPGRGKNDAHHSRFWYSGLRSRSDFFPPLGFNSLQQFHHGFRRFVDLALRFDHETESICRAGAYAQTAADTKLLVELDIAIYNFMGESLAPHHARSTALFFYA